MNCSGCGGSISNQHSANRNALEIAFYGDYGDFIETNEPITVIICHDCAHKLCGLVGWVRKLLDPEESHTHTVEYRKAHPAHYGQDYQ